jgi:hypothetical protein
MEFYKVQSDAEIVNAVLNGDKEVFAVLVKRYERPVRVIAMNVLGDYHYTLYSRTVKGKRSKLLPFWAWLLFPPRVR